MVKGSINAPNAITLAAQDIKIESGAKLLNTSKIDFSNLVNVENVNAGLDEDLVLKADQNGGVYISARVDDTTIDDNTSSFGMLNFGKTFTAAISVGKDAEIISDSDVTLNACALANRNSEPTSSLYFLSKLDLAGSIKAKNINLESKIIDKFTYSQSVSNDQPSEHDSSAYSDFELIKLFSDSYSIDFVKKDEATLNIAKTAKLEATNNINVSAASELTGKLSTEVSSKNDAGASAFNISYLDNSSALNIDGALKAGGNINIKSTAGVDLSSLVKIDFDQSNNTSTSLALNLAYGENKSQLTISNTADINAGGKLDISSLAKSPVDMETNIQREGTLTAKGDINISSKYSAPTYKVNTKISVSNPVSGMEQTEEEAEKTKEAGAAINELINGSGNSSGSSDSGDDEETPQDNTTTNGTVVIANNSAYLNLGKATSEGNVNIEAADVIDDPQIGSISVVPVQEEGGSITPVVVVAMIDNNSLIKLSDDRIPTRQKH